MRETFVGLKRKHTETHASLPPALKSRDGGNKTHFGLRVSKSGARDVGCMQDENSVDVLAPSESAEAQGSKREQGWLRCV